MHWRLPTRIAFRFCVVYFGLFCLAFAQITFVFTGVLSQWLPDRAVLWQMLALEPVTGWVGRTVFGVDSPLTESGSGDQAAIWVLIFWLLAVAVVATAIWSVLDRRRAAYPRLAAWFTTFLRLCLGGQMLFYGFAKVIPTQMPTPPLSSLLEPFGNLSPMAVLWLQVGSSHPYEIALGAVEVVAGLLLFWPRTALLGALLSVVGTGQIFLLNMTYDVPVKILSFHLLVISVILVAPHVRRLADVLVLQRQADPFIPADLFSSARRNRIAVAVQLALGVWVAAGCVAINVAGWYEYGDGRTKPELYGIWSVTEFTVGGDVRPPLTTDEMRWQRVVFDHPGVVTHQRMDGELVDEPATQTGDVLTVGTTTLAIDRQGPDRLRLDGKMDGKPVTIELQRQPLDDFTLRSRGFHWVQETPYFG
ncbi:DoxX family protein [Mycolicibacterium sp. YH-1]|uniref:DoxX family protein n=1 Tax=Mycolicibacterium sp. YH-1 TaxID=2908837 RepID=UPI001F4BD01A|nr:DoxX family protein [Mycolicibacterium sp. YH-1]UNB53616.1 DoxX family protein [Mycolicibacterium sp. YH-1]